MAVKLKKIPDFKTLDEEADFWDTHDFTDYVDFSKKEKIKVIVELDKPKDSTIIIRIQKKLRDMLEKAALAKGISPSTLGRMWIIEKLQEKCYN